MRHNILLIICLLFLYACDKEIIHDFVIENNCDKSISIAFENANSEEYTALIQSNKVDTFYTLIGYSTQVHPIDLNRLFKSFKISCDTIESKIDYKSNDVWEYIEKSDTYAIYYLEVDSTHFE
jgi:hypothetical protein